MQSGILLLATSHPYYGRMAYNLAVSIRATGSQVPIAVLHNGRGLAHLNEKQKSIFTIITEIQQEAFIAKTHLYNHTPFQHTLYIDVDTVWMQKRKPEDLFASIKEEERFKIIVEGWLDPATGENKLHPKYMTWADIDELKAAYQLKGKLYQFRSEMMYFKKTAEVAKFFKTAQKIQANPKVSVQQFGGHIPDELAFNVASSVLEFEPDDLAWKPSYWFNIHRKMIPMPILAQQFYVLSAGGNFANPTIKKLYNQIMKAASYKQRVQYLFTLQSKRDSIKERQTM